MKFANNSLIITAFKSIVKGVLIRKECVFDAVSRIYMPALDRPLFDCIAYTCRRLIDLSLIALHIHAGA